MDVEDCCEHRWNRVVKRIFLRVGELVRKWTAAVGVAVVDLFLERVAYGIRDNVSAS